MNGMHMETRSAEPEGGAKGGAKGSDEERAEKLKANIRTAFEAESTEAKAAIAKALEESKRSLSEGASAASTKLLEEAKRSLSEEVKGMVQKILEEAKRSLNESATAFKTDLERERAHSPGAQEGDGVKPCYRALKEAMIQAATERRAVTIGMTGNVQVVPTLVSDGIKNYSKITKGLSYFYGPNAETVIPLIGVPDEAIVAENGTITDDSTTALDACEVKPKAHVVQLPISAETLLMSGANIESQLPAIFEKSFGKGMASGAMQGAGTGNLMTGLFAAAALSLTETCAAAGKPTWDDIMTIVLDAKDMWDDAVLTLNPAFVANLLADTTAESAPLKTAFLMTGAILGMPVIATGYAPSDTTSGAVLAVAGPLSNFGVGIALQMIVEPIVSATSTQRLFRATMFYNGKPISKKNGYALLAK